MLCVVLLQTNFVYLYMFAPMLFKQLRLTLTFNI